MRKLSKRRKIVISLIAVYISAILLGIAFAGAIGIGYIYAATIGAQKISSYFDNIDGIENSDAIFHYFYPEGMFYINGENIISPAFKGPYDYGSSESVHDYHYYGATSEELFYYVEVDKHIEFYRSNYNNNTYKLIRSFGKDEILYHKCDTVIYLGTDGQKHIFNAFDMTDEIYDGVVPTHEERYTITSTEKDFIIKDNATGEEKKTGDLNKIFRKHEYVKQLGPAPKIKYVFAHDNNVYIVYCGTFTVAALVFKYDFETDSISLVSWCPDIAYMHGDKTYYLDRVNFAE